MLAAIFRDKSFTKVFLLSCDFRGAAGGPKVEGFEHENEHKPSHPTRSLTRLIFCGDKRTPRDHASPFHSTVPNRQSQIMSPTFSVLPFSMPSTIFFTFTFS